MKTWMKRYPLMAYFLMAFAITWVGSTLYVLTLPKWGSRLPAFLGTPGMVIWYFGPFLSAILVSRVAQGPGAIRGLLQRFTLWKVGWRWYAFILCYPLILHLMTTGSAWLLGGPAPRFFEAEGVPVDANPGVTLLILALYNLLIRGVGEETGWRGFALPGLQTHWNPLTSSLVLGVVWAAWHFHPANAALLSPAGVFVFLNIFATTFIFTYVYNHTQGSLLIAALFHMVLNVAEWVVPIGIVNASLPSKITQLVILFSIVVVLALQTKANRSQADAVPAQ